MKIEDLPVGDAPQPPEYHYFPTRWQLVLWRNWRFVPAARLAELLGCDDETIRREAAKLGLPELPDEPQWLKLGYQTVIRANWQLLNYRQLLQLLGWAPERLAQVLKEEDFLFTKLGAGKPAALEVRYAPLSPEAETATERLRDSWQKHLTPEALRYIEPPFSFPEHVEPVTEKSPGFSFNLIHAYSAGCGDLLADIESADPLPEDLLRTYAAMGIEGVWIHSILYFLHPIPGAESYSGEWHKRLENLRTLARRCRKYGLGLYLYWNEPRGMPYSFYERKPEWSGADCPVKAMRSNCTSVPGVLAWLEEASEAVFRAVPELEGVFLINMSENPTHCASRALKHNCPACRDRDTADLIAESIQALRNGIRRAAPEARIIVNDWAWAEQKPDKSDFDNLEFKQRVLSKLPADLCYLAISEWGKAIRIGGVPHHVSDYSISQVGPSEEARAMWHFAARRGMKTVAKIQLNNSWELSAVPYLPVPYLLCEHLDRLRGCGVDGVMLSWTLGGYPGGNLPLLHMTPEELAELRFGADASAVCSAWRSFSEAFREFPFSIVTLYHGPMNFGPSCPLFDRATNRKSSMIGFPFDDLEMWRSVYPAEVFEAQFRKLAEGWRAGLRTLDAIPADTPALRELRLIARAAGCHWESSWNQIRFIRARDANKREAMREAAAAELTVALQLLDIARRDSRIGFETSNHYLYTINDLVEKVINCEALLARL